jgi:hypothetical protein
MLAFLLVLDMNNFSLPAIFTPHSRLLQTLDVAMDDCVDLLCAVGERLRSTADQDFVSTCTGYLHKQVQPTHTTILECAAALDQIGQTLSYEITRSKTLELEVQALRAELTQRAAKPMHPCASF